MVHPSSVLRTIALTRESLARFAESSTIPDEDFMRVLSAYFALSPSGATAYAAPESAVGQVGAASSL